MFKLSFNQTIAKIANRTKKFLHRTNKFIRNSLISRFFLYTYLYSTSNILWSLLLSSIQVLAGASACIIV